MVSARNSPTEEEHLLRQQYSSSTWLPVTPLVVHLKGKNSSSGGTMPFVPPVARTRTLTSVSNHFRHTALNRWLVQCRHRREKVH